MSEGTPPMPCQPAAGMHVNNALAVVLFIQVHFWIQPFLFELVTQFHTY